MWNSLMTKRRMIGRPLLAAMIVTVLPSAAHAGGTIRYVDDSAPPGGNGTTWALAHNTLQAALAALQTGDEIRVAQGVYKPGSAAAPRASTFSLVSGTLVQGGFAGFGAPNPNEYNPFVFVTRLSGDLNGDDGPDFANYGDNCFHVVTCDGAGIFTELRGLTISNGNADARGPNDPNDYGAGVRCLNNSMLTVEGCIFERNRAVYGGGGLYAPDGQIFVTACSFLRNVALNSSVVGGGGGIRMSQGTVTDSIFLECDGAIRTSSGGGIACANTLVTNCVFQECLSGGIACGSDTTIVSCSFLSNFSENGGGVSVGGSNVRLSDCTFVDNGAGFGGAMFITGNDVTVINCRMLDNSADSGNAVLIFAKGSASFTNCLFSGNSFFVRFRSAEATFYNTGGTSMLINCTFSLNETARDTGAVLTDSGATTHLRNCILWGNSAKGVINEAAQISGAGTLTIDNSCVHGWTGSLGGVGNDGLNPLLIDPDGVDNIVGTLDDNCRLPATSPSRNAGSNASLPPDTYDLDGDNDTAEPIPFDLDLLPRVSQGIVDRGAYEFRPLCAADIAPSGGNGVVNVDDLLTVISDWGPCPAPPAACPANIVNTGTSANRVDVDDLLAVISGWGACP